MALSPAAQRILEAQKAKMAQQKGVVGTQAVTTPVNKAEQEHLLANNSALLASLSDLVPNLDDSLPADAAPTESQDYERDLDRFIDSLSFKEAYEKFAGKGPVAKWSGADENNFVRCPSSRHEDKKPSTWFRISTKVWKCGGCDDGGGIIDLVGAAMGVSSSQERKGKNYHDIRRHIARAYGWQTFTRLDGTTGVVPPSASVQPASVGGKFAELLRAASPAAPAARESPAEPAAAAEPGPRTAVPQAAEPTEDRLELVESARVLHIAPPPLDDLDPLAVNEDGTEGIPDIPWREIFQDETFIRTYMEANCSDDSPEMYHLWSALLLLGMTTGRNVTLKDRTPVYGNLSVCMLGDSGWRKTRSRGPMFILLRDLMPYDPDEDIPEGVALVLNAKTGEGLTKAFARPLKETVKGQTIETLRGNVKGVAVFEELSELMSLGRRPGATIKEALMAGADCGNSAMGGTTKAEGGYIASDHYMSAWISTQPDRLEELLEKADKSSGFLNRWIFAAGTKKPRIQYGEHVDLDLRKASMHYKLIRDQFRSLGVYSMEMQGDALIEFNNFLNNEVYPAMDTGKTDMLARADLMIKKLTLLLTVNAGQVNVTVDIINQVRYFFPYLLETYRLIDVSVGRPTRGDLEAFILQVIRKWHEDTGEFIPMGKLKTKTRTNRLVKEFGGDAVHKALAVLKAWGDIEIHDPEQKKGRPTQRIEALA